jgi:hypothetical protein
MTSTDVVERVSFWWVWVVGWLLVLASSQVMVKVGGLLRLAARR